MKERKKRAAALVLRLKKLFPRARIALDYSNNWELFVAVVLSAQCTDKKVNEVTKTLFKKYRTLDDYAHADDAAFAQDIRSTGFYRNKAKNILASAKKVKSEFGGKVPKTMEEILTLPGIARKSANVILGNAYGVVEGIAVDTHVMRLSQRFGLTKERTPEKIERDLMEILPKKEWFGFTYRLIEYGRTYCPARTCPPDHPLEEFDPVTK
ncbi:MAG: endonuclease III [Parcubacteria group bacterium]|nr:endonuclease III [Parcubacteria group bacterium]